MVERATNMTLEAYMQSNIWGPLGIANITFNPKQRPDMLERMPDMSERQGGLSTFGTALDPSQPVAYTANRVWSLNMADNNGGIGCYGSVIDYQKIVHTLVVGDGKLLGSAMLDKLFEPQLEEAAQAYLTVLLKIKELRNIMGMF